MMKSCCSKGPVPESGKPGEYDLRARVIKALGHPTRLMMVYELSRGERCVCELTDLAKADISTVSKHLLILKDVGIVQDRKVGKWIYYSLRTTCVLEFLKCVEKVLKGRVTSC